MNTEMGDGGEEEEENARNRALWWTEKVIVCQDNCVVKEGEEGWG